MRSRTKRGIFSWLLIAAGSYLAFLGSREYFQSRLGQYEAEREFNQVESRRLEFQQLEFEQGKRGHGKRVSPRPASHVPSTTNRPNHSQVRSGEAIAKLIIPRLNAQLYVLEGIAAKQLRRGPAHMTGTALPGDKGNCIIAGHRDTHFRVLKDIRKGDDILFKTSRGDFLYRVRTISIVSPNHRGALRDTDDARLHLITCYPFYWVGTAPRRFIVEAELAAVLAASRPI